MVTWSSSFKEPTYAKKHAVAVANIYTSGGINSDENTELRKRSHGYGKREERNACRDIWELGTHF